MFSRVIGPFLLYIINNSLSIWLLYYIIIILLFNITIWGNTKYYNIWGLIPWSDYMKSYIDTDDAHAFRKFTSAFEHLFNYYISKGHNPSFTVNELKKLQICMKYGQIFLSIFFHFSIVIFSDLWYCMFKYLKRGELLCF